MTNPFIGCGVALVTPFDLTGSIDFLSLKKLVRLQITGGTNFLVVQGTTGESPTLSQKEKELVLQAVIEENNGQLKIVYGIGVNNTIAVGEALKQLPQGVDGILSVSPYYNKPTQRGIIEHYTYLSKCSELPFIIYNMVAVKEASGNMEQIMEIIRQRQVSFGVLSGDDNLTMPLISAGADGVISVVANAFPELFSKMVNASLQGDLITARSVHYDLFSITKMFFEEGNPGGVKVALGARGLMQEHMRLPLMPVSSGLANRIKSETERLLSL
jgi:4-hydroxy-tetrahydrodipicolinate synthase